VAYDKLKDESYQNFGGINVKASDYTTGPNEVLDLRNYTFVRPGRWDTRHGVEVSYSLAKSSFSLMPRSNIQYIKDDGSSYQLFDSGQTLYLRGSNTALSGSLSPGLTAPLIDYVVQNNYLYLANGYASKRYDGSNTVEWNVLSGLTGVGVFIANTQTSFSLGCTFNISLTPTNGQTVILSALDFNWQHSIAGMRNSYSLQTVAVAFNSFHNANGASFRRAIFPDHLGNGFSLPGAPTFVGFGQWVLFGFTMLQGYGLSTVIIQKGSTYGLTMAYPQLSRGIDTQYLTNIQYSAPVSFNISLFPGVSTFECVTFDHFTTSVFNYRFQDPLNLFPKYLQTYNNMLFMANITGQTTPIVVQSQPSTVYFSNLGEPEQVEDDSFFEIRTGNGDEITGMINFQTNLIIFKKYSVHEVSGTSPDTLSVRDLTLEYGCVNNRAAVAFENTLWFVDINGIIQYNGSSFRNISSEKVKIYMDQVDKTKMSALHIKKDNEVWFSADQKTFVYDYLADAWSIYDNLNIDQNAGPAVMNYGASVVDATYWQSGASYHESVRFNDSLNTDFGQAITHVIKTRYHKRLGDSTQELWRRFYLNSDGASGLNATLNFYPDYGTSIYLQRSFGIDSFQERIDFGISAKSLSIEMIIKSSQYFSINGYTVESRYLRSV